MSARKLYCLVIQRYGIIPFIFVFWNSLSAQIHSSWINVAYPEGVKSLSIVHVFKDSIKIDTSTEVTTIYYSKEGKQDSIVKTYKDKYVYKEMWYRDRSLNRYIRVDYDYENNKISKLKEVINDSLDRKKFELITTFYDNKPTVKRSEFIYCSDTTVYKITYKNDTLNSIYRNQVLNGVYVVTEEKCIISDSISKVNINCEYLKALRVSNKRNYDIKIINGFIVNTVLVDNGDCIELQYLLNDDYVYKNHVRYDSNANMITQEYLFELKDTVFSINRFVNNDEDIEYYYFENKELSIMYVYNYREVKFDKIIINKFNYEYDKNENWIRRDERNLQEKWEMIVLRKIEYY